MAGKILRDAAGSATGIAVLAVGGLTASLAAAACCALPIGLAMLGLGSAWLGGLASFAAPYRTLLPWVALACVGAGLALAYRPRPASACATGLCATWISRAAKGGLWIAGALVAAAMAIE